MANYGKLFSLGAVAMVLACDSSSPGSVGTPGGSGAGNTFGTGGAGSVGNTGQGGTVSGSVPGVTAPNPGGTWVVPPDSTGGGPGHGGPKGAGGAGGPSGTTPDYPVSPLKASPSRHRSTSRVAPATSLAPQALKNSVPPPNVPVPKQSTGTLKPDRPSCRDSIMSLV
jgi:hypothetical protein